jgi:hypothetical protein
MVAVAHAIIVRAYHMLKRHQAYYEQGQTSFGAPKNGSVVPRLVARLGRLGDNCSPCHPSSPRLRLGADRDIVASPPPSAPARCRQELFAFDDAHASVSPEATWAPRRRIAPLRG